MATTARGAQSPQVILLGGFTSARRRRRTKGPSAQTTWRYARFNLELKRKATETCALKGPRRHLAPEPAWRRDADLFAHLEALGKREPIYVE